MNSILFKIAFGCLLTLLFAHTAVAQSGSPTANSQPNVQIAEPMSDGDRLPFMQNESASVQTESSAGGMLLKTLGALLLIVGTIFFAAWGLRKFGVNLGWLQPNNVVVHDAPDLAVINTVNLGNGRTLAMVKFGERTLLIGSTAQNFTLLADQTGEHQNALRQNRSVGDLLAEENDCFAKELTAADSRLDVFDFKQS